MRVGFLTATCMLPGHPDEREDSWEHEAEYVPMEAACAALGIRLEAVVWDDPQLQPSDYDAFVIGTTWDYAEKPEQFLRVLEQLSAAKPLFNSLDIVRWNLDKRYLVDLEQKGIQVVPTLWRSAADQPTIDVAFQELSCQEVVVKPQVGASAWRQVRVKQGDPLPPAEELPLGACMIQPFLPAAVSEGEYSFLFFGGRFSHCALKRSAPGDYRVQSMYGGKEVIHEPSAAELAQAAAVLQAVEEPLLYARVDVMRGADGELLLMELELIEPYLYPEQGPRLGETFAAALHRLLG